MTFGKVTVSDAKPAQSNEKHLFANAKSAIGQILRQQNKQATQLQLFCKKVLSKNFGGGTMWGEATTATFAKVAQNPLGKTAFFKILIMRV